MRIQSNIFFQSFLKLFVLSNFLYQPVIAKDSPPIWTTVQAKGPTGSAFFKTISERNKEIAKRQDCINTIAGAALGGFIGNRIFGGKSGAAIGAAAGGAIGASSGPDC